MERDRFRLGNGALDEADVLGCDDRTALDLFPRLVVDEPHLNGIATDLKRIDADDRARQPLANVGVHALDHGDDGDEKCDGDDDPEQGEEGSQLVAPNGQEREAERFGDAHGTKLPCNYS